MVCRMSLAFQKLNCAKLFSTVHFRTIIRLKRCVLQHRLFALVAQFPHHAIPYPFAFCLCENGKELTLRAWMEKLQQKIISASGQPLVTTFMSDGDESIVNALR